MGFNNYAGKLVASSANVNKSLRNVSHGRQSQV